MEIKISELGSTLGKLIDGDFKTSVMIWGKPGIGKSAIVAQIARNKGIGFKDVRLGQLAPTDLRGLPVPKDGKSHWYPPSFLPSDANSRGILFLDEFNMAPPAIQGIAQQLVLDRRVGDYELPEGWVIWAAGNRKEDRATVFELSGPISNRFVHYEVDTSMEEWRDYAIKAGVNQEIVGFLSYMPNKLHEMPKAGVNAWPSPRSWEIAAKLHELGLPIQPAVGAAAVEFDGYRAVYQHLPDIDAIFAGRGANIKRPGKKNSDVSLWYAISVAIAYRARNPQEAVVGIDWLDDAEFCMIAYNLCYSKFGIEMSKVMMNKATLDRFPNVARAAKEAGTLTGIK